MTTLREQFLVHCSPNQAPTHLAHFFRSCGNADGDVAVLALRADIELDGAPDLGLERTAIATIMPCRVRGHYLTRYAISWVPERHGPYPMFTGDLSIVDGDDYGSVYVVLTGRYEPPLGPLGAAFDALIGRRIAERCAHNLLATIAGSIEADFSAVEERKSAARSRMAPPLAPASSPPA